MDQPDIIELAENIVELDPELQAHMEERGSISMIRHPLVLSLFHMPVFNGMVNEALKAKKQRLKEAKEREDWESYIGLHERPFRMQALVDIFWKLTDSRKGWKVVGGVWVDSEFPYVNRSSWKMIFEHPKASWMMDSNEAAKLKLWQEEEHLMVWRGSSKGHSNGFSWTTDRRKAIWFAKRFDEKRPVLATRKIDPRTDVVAYLTGRGEDEIILKPKVLRSRKGLMIDEL